MALSSEDKQQILEYFESDLSSEVVGALFETSHTTVQKIWSSVHTKEELHERRTRLMRQHKGENHHAYRGGVTHLSSGYKLVQAPEWYEGYKDKRGRALEHLVKYCEYNNLTSIPPGFHVHHRNEDKGDSSPENLTLMSNSEHSTTHAVRRNRDYQGRFL